MNLLAIDTSTEKASIALLCGNQVQSFEKLASRQHAQVLLPTIHDFLAQAEISMAQLDGIVFGRGPGSFTGLRIACSVVKGLAFAQDLPVYPVSTLQTIQSITRNQRVEKNPAVLAILDARMKELYWCFYPENGASGEEQVSAPEEIQTPTTTPFVLAGVGFEDYLDKLPSKTSTLISESITVYPAAEEMIAMVQSGQVKPVSALEAEPLYIRNQVTHGGPGG